MHAGTDFLRSKGGDHNSYRSPDSVNQLDWGRKQQYLDMHNYYRKLIALRKAHPAFRMATADLVEQHLSFLPQPVTEQLVAYQITGNANGDAWRNIVVVHNANNKIVKAEVPAGTWQVVIDDDQIDQEGLRTVKGKKVTVKPISTLVLVQQ